MKSRISALVAMARNRVIGCKNALPWHLPPDLKRFKSLTMGHPIIMGRKTYESIGMPLPGRISIIVTRQADYHVSGAIVVDSLTQALQACSGKAQGPVIPGSGADEETFVIGGAEIFRQALPLCDRIYLTEIHCSHNSIRTNGLKPHASVAIGTAEGITAHLTTTSWCSTGKAAKKTGTI
jgi:dihydrofolate reductase